MASKQKQSLLFPKSLSLTVAEVSDDWYLIMDHTWMTPSSEAEISRVPSWEKAKQLRGFWWAGHILSSFPLVTFTHGMNNTEPMKPGTTNERIQVLFKFKGTHGFNWALWHFSRLVCWSLLDTRNSLGQLLTSHIYTFPAGAPPAR